MVNEQRNEQQALHQGSSCRSSSRKTVYMSLAALLQGTRNHLRTQLTLGDEECGCQNDGQPPPSAGQRYVSVHATAWSPGDTSEVVMGIDETYSITCTITVRAAIAPRDRQTDSIFLGDLGNLESLARLIMVAVHQDWTHMGVVNDLIDSDVPPAVNLFVEPLRWTGTDPTPTTHDASWIFADPNKNPLAFMSLGVHFGRARRLQRQSIME